MLAKKYIRYKKYADGGDSGIAGGKAFNAAGAAAGAGFVGQAFDALTPADQWGRRSAAAGAASGAMSGAAAGASLGPIGMAAGAVIGGVTGLLNQKKANALGNSMYSKQLWDYDRAQDKATQARVASDPSIVKGNLAASYYANGGQLKPMSSDSVEVEGPSHEQGGVQIPQAGAEVEGGETIDKGYVFSKQLGFADLHKPIAKAIGKIEEKPMSFERVNSLKLLNHQEDNLKLSQEFVRQKFGLQ